jgi:poly-beta-hydroxyalkanoate depolymerase
MLLTVEGKRDDICAVGQTVGRARPVQQAAP